ncbi:unnamed protein product [Phytophthora fragariaefolia]|uniref:Unnamed protein product n=1 Tax=Phytophthora fragariaefolia TaxID=1490495 RepID=A0A9W7D5U7_9STRA|nr:unnamed protein product [Phytophthora fragariaefolia]
MFLLQDKSLRSTSEENYYVGQQNSWRIRTMGEMVHFTGSFYHRRKFRCRLLLDLKDEATHLCELTPCPIPTSAVAVEAILAWHSRFGIPPLWISDQGSHFKNAVVAEVCRRLKSRQDFTLAYSPWINGSIERANRDIIQVLRALCLEYKVDTHDWTFFIRKPKPYTNFCMNPRQHELLAVPEQPTKISKWLTALKESIQDMHKPMVVAQAQQTARNQRHHKGKQPNFDIGDYVLRSRVDHCSLHITEEIREHIAAQGLVLSVEGLKDHVWNNDKRTYDILVSWKGLEPIEASWEPATSLARDIPVIPRQYAGARQDERFAQRIQRLAKTKRV